MELSVKKIQNIKMIKKTIGTKKELLFVFKMGEQWGRHHGYSKGYNKNKLTLLESKEKYSKNTLNLVIMLGAQAVNLDEEFVDNCQKLIGKEELCSKIFFAAFDKGYVTGINQGKKDLIKRKKEDKKEQELEKKSRRSNNYNSVNYTSSPSIHPDLERVNKLLQDQEILDWENKTGKYAPVGIRD